jgi:hypothetical protein
VELPPVNRAPPDPLERFEDFRSCHRGGPLR